VIRIAGSDVEAGTAVFKARTSGQSRLELDFSSGRRVEIHAEAGDPKGAWIDGDDKSHAVARHNSWVETAWFSPAVLFSSLLYRLDKGVLYAGREVRDGKQVEHMLVWRQVSGQSEAASAMIQKLSQHEIYLAADSLLPMAVTFNVHPDEDANTDIPVEIRYSDYRSIGGVRVPFRVQKFVNGSLVLDFLVEGVATNSGPPDVDFVVPQPEGGDL